MKFSTIAFCLISALSVNAAASAMSPEKSKCLTMEYQAQKFNAWKADFHKFQNNLETINEQDRFVVSRAGLKKLTGLMNDLSVETSVKAPGGLMNDAQRLLVDMDNNDISTSAATHVMKKGLPKLEEAMDDMVYQAQSKFPNCDLQVQINTQTYNSSGTAVSK